jgi:hypothetical protein
MLVTSIEGNLEDRDVHMSGGNGERYVSGSKERRIRKSGTPRISSAARR